MSGIKGGTRAVSDLIEGRVVASVEIAAPPERVFQALSSREIVDWWVNPGVFDTREWAGAVQVGGKWRASGIARGKPYTLEGEFLSKSIRLENWCIRGIWSERPAHHRPSVIC